MNWRVKRNLTESDLATITESKTILLSELEQLRDSLNKIDFDELRIVLDKRPLHRTIFYNKSLRSIGTRLLKFSSGLRAYRRLWTYDKYRDHLDKKDKTYDVEHVLKNLML